MNFNKLNISSIILLVFIIIIYTLGFYCTLNNNQQNYKIQDIQQQLDSLRVKNKLLQQENKQLKEQNKKLFEIQKKINWLSQNNNIQYTNVLSTAIYFYSNKYNIDKDLLISIAFVESSFRKYAKSEAGCLGYFQINPNVHNINHKLIYNEYYNTKWACKILKQNLKIFNNNYVLALNAYNGWASIHNGYASKVLNLAIQLKEKINI
jgi:soluble lytic murein transglycosylase-like protein